MRNPLKACARTLFCSSGDQPSNTPGIPNACRDQRLPWFAARAADHALWRLSVPQTAPVLALPAGVAPPLVEWHGGLRWVQALPQHGDALHALAAEVGGSASLFIAASADGISARAVFDANSAALAAIHQRLKQAFDPAGIFNPGRLV